MLVLLCRVLTPQGVRYASGFDGFGLYLLLSCWCNRVCFRLL